MTSPASTSPPRTIEALHPMAESNGTAHASTSASRVIPLVPPNLHSPKIGSGLTGSVSGSASPLTRYGSFPPSTVKGKDLADRLRTSLSSLDGALERSPDRLGGNMSPKRKKLRRKQKFEQSQERLLFTRASRLRNGIGRNDDVYDSDADLSDDMAPVEQHPDDTGYRDLDSGDEDGVWYAGDREHGKFRRGRAWSRRSDAQHSRNDDTDKQWGVLKMEMMARTWGKKGLMTIYAGVYLISILTSLEGNTTPTIEPYFLSLLGSHSLLSTVVIVSNIAFAVGKPPMTKILDVFGRAEGVLLAASLYSLGYLLTASASDVRIFIVARAIAALGGQGLQLAQQVVVADTTTLSNRGLVTSTISLPWLATTWIGPVLGAFFQSLGPSGYRIAYALFGILLPLVAAVLFCTLFVEWHKVKLRANSAKKGGVTADSVESQEYLHKRANEDQLAQAMGLGRPGWVGKTKKVWKELDVIGLIALTLGCGLLLLPFTLAARRPASWADPLVWILIFLGAFTLVFFGIYEFHFSPLPLLSPRLLKNRTIVCGSLFGFFHFTSQFIYESFFTSFLQVARFQSPRDASYISQSYIFAASIAAIVAGFGAKLTNRYKWIGIVGVIVHMAGTWLMIRARNLDSPIWEIVASQLLSGVGGGFTTIAAQIGCQSVVNHQDVAIATAVFLTITQIGGAVGGAIAGSIWSSVLPAQLHHHLPPDSQDIVDKIMASLPYALSFEEGTPIRLAINHAYVDVQKQLNFLAILMLFPALLVACLMKNVNLESDDLGQGEGVVVLGRASFLIAEEDAGNSETSSLLGAGN